MEDLNFAIEVFKETNRTKELYRVTWWTAQALKSRVGLFEGTYRKYHGLGDYEKYLNDCVSASNEIMTASGGYPLYHPAHSPIVISLNPRMRLMRKSYWQGIIIMI